MPNHDPFPENDYEVNGDYEESGYDVEATARKIFGDNGQEEKVTETAIGETIVPPPIVPLIGPMTLMPVFSIEQAKQRRDTIYHFINDVLQEGKDYGKIPGVDKPNLLLPGAEQFRIFFGLTTKVHECNLTEDPFGVKLGTGVPYFAAEVKLGIYKDDKLICVGVGQANSLETKWGYRWKQLEPGETPPANAIVKSSFITEFEFAVNKAETSGQYGKPAEYWKQFHDAIANKTAKKIKKKDRNGREHDAWQIGGMSIRVANEEVYSQANVILKIANKRAKVDGIKDAIGISDIFTQDMEDSDLVAPYDPSGTAQSISTNPALVAGASGAVTAATQAAQPQPGGAAQEPAGAPQTLRPDPPMPQPVAGFQRAPSASGSVGVKPTQPPAKREKISDIPDVLATASNTAKVTPVKDPAPSVDLNAEENKRQASMADVRDIIEFAKQHNVSQKALINFVQESFNKKILSGTKGDEDRKVLITRGEYLKAKVFITNGLLNQDQQIQLARRANMMGVTPEKLAEYVYEQYGMPVKHLSMTQMLNIDEWLESNAQNQ